MILFSKVFNFFLRIVMVFLGGTLPVVLPCLVALLLIAGLASGQSRLNPKSDPLVVEASIFHSQVSSQLELRLEDGVPWPWNIRDSIYYVQDSKPVVCENGKYIPAQTAPRFIRDLIAKFPELLSVQIEGLTLTLDFPGKELEISQVLKKLTLVFAPPGAKRAVIFHWKVASEFRPAHIASAGLPH